MKSTEIWPKHLRIFTWVLFASSFIGLAYSIDVKDFATGIAALFGTWAFGSLILLTRKLDRRIKEIENE